MKVVFQNVFLSLILILICQGVASAETRNTLDHTVSFSYVTGVSDVVDFYDRFPGLEVDGPSLPIALSYKATYNLENGVRLDAGIGPAIFFSGDIDYDDVPLSLTVGYSFFPSKLIRPYLRGGFSYHIMDGDYVTEEANFGLLGAIGMEIGKRGLISGFLEISHDTAEATFEVNNLFGFYSDREEIKINNTLVSIGVIF